jgi:DNA-binding phage protein
MVEIIRSKYESLVPYLNERARRVWAATQARSLGWGGITQVCQATGLSRTTIYAGLSELQPSRGQKKKKRARSHVCADRAEAESG